MLEVRTFMHERLKCCFNRDPRGLTVHTDWSIFETTRLKQEGYCFKCMTHEALRTADATHPAKASLVAVDR